MQKTPYLRVEHSCLSLIYVAQKLQHYLLAHMVHLMTKSNLIRTLLQRPVLLGRLVQWLLQISEYDMVSVMPKAVKGQAIAELLAQFPKEDISQIMDEVPGEVAEVACLEENKCLWEMTFDGSFISTSGGASIVLANGENEALFMSFKLDFLCFNNAAEYKAYLTGLAITREMGIKRLKVRGDSNLVVSQAKGDFSLKEPSLAPYLAMA